MRNAKCLGALALVAAVNLCTPSRLRMDISAQSASPVLSGPHFEVDPFWPKPLPERWFTGELGGVCVDANDHVFVLSRANLYPGIAARAASSAQSSRSASAGPTLARR